MVVQRINNGQLVREGAGVKLKRFIGMERDNIYDPFLLLDVFKSDDPLDYIAGFPSHPHRGFETVTYLIKGEIEHQDNHGHHGIIQAGDVQWMTAGKGIIHSEMPKKSDGIWGIQLWLNLPAANKMQAPNYQEFKNSQLPVEKHANGITNKVIAGTTTMGISSPIKNKFTEPLFFDISIPLSQTISLKIPATHQGILFVLQGEVSLNQSQNIKQDTLASLGNEEVLTLKGVMAETTRCLFIAAKRLNEPVERLGPFVMNTREEVLKALEDFQNQRF